MLNRFKSFFWKTHSEPMYETSDPVLGKLEPIAEEGWWIATVEVVGRNITFKLGGDAVPDAP